MFVMSSAGCRTVAMAFRRWRGEGVAAVAAPEGAGSASGAGLAPASRYRSGFAEGIQAFEAATRYSGGDRGVGMLRVDAVGRVPGRRVVAVRVAVAGVAEDGDDRTVAAFLAHAPRRVQHADEVGAGGAAHAPAQRGA